VQDFRGWIAQGLFQCLQRSLFRQGERDPRSETSDHAGRTRQGEWIRAGKYLEAAVELAYRPPCRSAAVVAEEDPVGLSLGQILVDKLAAPAQPFAYRPRQNGEGIGVIQSGDDFRQG
jgi:hypothetical protein